MKYPPVQYHDYLKLSPLLTAQSPRSEEFGRSAHDEMLFIIVHQTYELWFKQILTEINTALKVFSQNLVPEAELSTVVHRLERVVKILDLLIEQVDVLETMTPMDFLEFRDLLYPASGFQSAQFRLLENKLGLKPTARLQYNSASYLESLPEHLRLQVQESEKEESLYSGIVRWLERTPYLQSGSYDFWSCYRAAIEKLFEEDAKVIGNHPHLSEEQRALGLSQLQKTRTALKDVFDPSAFENMRAQGHWRLSYRAFHAALFIQSYRDHLALQMPHRLLNSLMDMDERLTTWRMRHAQMAMRMLGSKMGTGGSSGHQYLASAAAQHRVFDELMRLSTYYIPRSALPEIPDELRRQLSLAGS